MSIKKILTEPTLTLLTFFVFFITSLFLGDGKQPFVDAWWALGILTMYGIRHYRRGKLGLQPLPRPIGLAWTALIVYYIVLIPFSDSAGYSISATVRLIEGYLVYVFFSTLAQDSRNQGPPDSGNQTIELFKKGLLFVGVVATLASFVFLIFPALARFLPPMNLLYANYGHNHLADLLLFIFPVAIGLAEKKKNIWALGALGLFSVGMIFTFARGAWMLLVFYLLLFVVKNKNPMTRKAGLVVATAIVAALLFVSLASIRGPTQGSGTIARFVRQIQKPSLVADGRWEYWRQAIEAIKERPLFGSGPGTFYLESKRLQNKPSSWSWFAHSYPLQIAVENGAIGLAMVLYLFWNIFQKTQSSPLRWGAVLVLVYSIYEFSLDYTAMWLLVLVVLGNLTKQTAQTTNHSKVTVIALVFLVLFYASSVGSVIASVVGNQPIAFFLAPYNVDTFIQINSKNTTHIEYLSPKFIYLLRAFHRKDSSVHNGIANYYVSVGPYERANNYFQEALRYDSKNIETHRRYLESIYKNKDTKALNKEIGLMLRTFFSRDYLVKTKRDDVFIPDVPIQPPTELFPTNATVDHVRLFLAKMYYFYGLAVFEKDPKHTENLWILARDLNPTLSYYHIELASLKTNTLHDNIKGQEFLAYCQQYAQASPHCADFINKNFLYALSDYPPGYFAKDIRDFPLL